MSNRRFLKRCSLCEFPIAVCHSPRRLMLPPPDDPFSESTNPLFGTAHTPYQKGRTAGGSSSGEGALLGSDASPLGFGSDVGGSLCVPPLDPSNLVPFHANHSQPLPPRRIPAHFSGCYGLKPCLGRFPSEGCVSPNPGFEAIKSSLGPMGRSVADLELATRVVVDASVDLARTQPLLPLKYREVKLEKKLKFGYYLSGTCSRGFRSGAQGS